MRILRNRLPRPLLRCVAIPLCAGALFASAPSAGSIEPGSALEKALASVSVDHIRSDIFFIGSDEMGGRDTPSPQQRIVARYIRARLERMGFKPGAQKGYFFEYPLFWPKIDEKGTNAGFERGDTKLAFSFGHEYYFVARKLADYDQSAGIVFCGRGKEADFTPAVSGKWALVFDENQGTNGVESAAKTAGAVGVIFTPLSNYSGKPYAGRFARDVVSASRAAGDRNGNSVQWPQAKPADAPKDLPMLWLTRESAQRIVALDTLENSKDVASRPAIEGTFRASRKLVGDNGIVKLEDVCGFWPGSDPVLSKEVIIISAHYDHVGTDSKGVVYNGADDNGSGTTGLLALSEALSAAGPLRRSVMLMWVSGEEKGLFGSQAWTEHPWLPEGCKPVCDINIDMIGRNEPDKLLITPTSGRKEYNGLVKLAEANSALEGFPKLGSCDAYWDRSDHRNFAVNLKIPVTFLFSDVHEDYHQTTDDPEKIDCDKIHRVVRLVLRMVDGLQGDQLDL